MTNTWDGKGRKKVWWDGLDLNQPTLGFQASANCPKAPLSYRPSLEGLVGRVGVEPTSPVFQTSAKTASATAPYWRRRTELNRLRPALQAGALPMSYVAEHTLPQAPEGAAKRVELAV